MPLAAHVVAQQRGRLIDVDDQDIDVAVIVEVAERATSAGMLFGHSWARFLGQLFKLAFAEVAIKQAWSPVRILRQLALQAGIAALGLDKLFPNDPEVLYHAGRLFGNYAYLTFSKLSAVAPDSVWRHQAAGEAFESEGQIDRALVEYRRVLELDPNRPGIHFRVGRALFSSSLGEAMQAFLAELKIDPTNANAAYEVGEIHRRAGEFEPARQYFEQAIRSYPSFEQARLGLAQTLLSLDAPADALTHLQAAIEINPRNEVSFYRLAQAQRLLGNQEEQRKALAEYQRLRSSSAGETAARSEVTPQRVEEP